MGARIPNSQIKPNVGGNTNNISFKGQSYSKDLGNATTRQLVYQGTKNTLITAAEALTIGAHDNEYGYLMNWQLKQQDAVFWNLNVNYSNQDPYSITVNIGTATQPTTYTCTTVMKSLALQTRANYKYIWNHVLIYLDTKDGNSAYTPPSYETVAALNSSNYKSIINASNGHLKWIKDANEMPTQPVYEETVGANNEPVQTPHYWKIAYQCSKPGVEYYQMPTYEITQSSRSRGQPTWWKNNLPGKIVAPSNTFGITGGQWLCHGGQIRYDGKAYDASCTYQWTPGEWDSDLYDTTV